MNLEYGDHKFESSEDLREGAKKSEELHKRLAVKAILDRYTACTISVEDAVGDLTTILASQPVSEIDVAVNSLQIKSTSFCSQQIWLNGQEIDCCNKLTLIIEARHKPRFIMEGVALPPWKPKEESKES